MKIDIMNDDYWEHLNRTGEMIPENWNERCRESIKKGKAEIEKRYNIRISQTEIYCAICGKPWPGCPHSPSVKQEYNHPMIGKGLEDYQEGLGVTLGMPKEEALERFSKWRLTKATCQRCGGEEYVEYCPFHLICEQAEQAEKEGEYERSNVERDGDRRRVIEADGIERVRVSVSEERERVALR